MVLIKRQLRKGMTEEPGGGDLNFLQRPAIPQSSTLGRHKGELDLFTQP